MLVQGAIRQHPVRVGNALLLFLEPHTPGPVSGAVQLNPGPGKVALVVKLAHGAHCIPFARCGQDPKPVILLFCLVLIRGIIEQSGRVGQGIDFFPPLPKEAAEEIWRVSPGLGSMDVVQDQDRACCVEPKGNQNFWIDNLHLFLQKGQAGLNLPLLGTTILGQSAFEEIGKKEIVPGYMGM